MKLKWTKCCNQPGCTRVYPTNIGFFYRGSGFSPKEAKLMDKAFKSIAPADIKKFLGKSDG